MTFADELNLHVERLGITGVLSAFERAGDKIGRRTLEQWRKGRTPRAMIQRGALQILEEVPNKDSANA